MEAFLGNVTVNDFSFDELVFTKRVRTPGGPVVKKIKRTSFFFEVKGLKNNPIINEPNFIYDLKKKLEDIFGWKFKRVNVRYLDPNTIEVEA